MSEQLTDGGNFRKERNQNGVFLTREELAERAGICRRTLYNYLKDFTEATGIVIPERRRISPKVVEEIDRQFSLGLFE